MSAHAALRRGVAFVAAGLAGPGRRVSPRVAGNALAELDRLFHVLVHEVAGAKGARPSSHQRHTANKLAIALDRPGGVGADDHRLRALYRSAASLRHCAGLARHPDTRGGATMTLGWSDREGGALRASALGETMAPTQADLRSVSIFYDRIATELLATRQMPRSPSCRTRFSIQRRAHDDRWSRGLR